MRARTILAASMAAVLACAAAACGDDSASDAPVALTMVAYDSFPKEGTPLNDALQRFTDATGITVDVVTAGDTGTMVSKAVLTAGNPEGDVMWGVDNTLLSAAVDGKIFDGDPSAVDFGDVCVNYDIAWFDEHGVQPPTTLADLLLPAYKDLLVVENPATSSPGLAFLLSTVAEYGDDGWEQFWTDLRANGVDVVDSWDSAYYERFSGAGGSAGDRPLVVSYGSSPPAEVVFSDPKVDTAPTGVSDHTCFRQTEYAGVLRGTNHADAAAQLVAFLTGTDFQKELPLTLFVYPIDEATPLPDVFTKFAVVPDDPYTMEPERIAANRQQWQDTWNEIVLQVIRLPRWAVAALAVVPCLSLLVFYAWPLATLLARVVDRESVTDTLRIPGLRHVLWFTFWQAVASTVLTLLIGSVPAYLLARYRFAGRRAVVAMVTVPFMLPTVVVGAAFLALLPRSWHGTVAAVVVAHVFFNVAVIVRLVGAMWAVLPTDLTAAARTLGASEPQVLRHVVLPLLRPALWAAASVVFLFTFTSFGVVKLLGGAANPTLEVEVARRATQLGDIDGAAVLSMFQLLALGTVVWWSARWQRRAAVTFHGTATTRRARSARERRVLHAGVAATVVGMLTPLVFLVARSFRIGGHWSLTAWRTLGDDEIRPGISLGVDPVASLSTSLRFALVATVMSVVVGGTASLAIAAARRRGRLLDAGLMLPLGTSAVTIGLGMLITFDQPPFDWRAKWWLVPLGHALVATPFVVRSVLPVLRAIGPDQRAAAVTLGATPLRAWWEVEVRRIGPALAAGAGFAAAISLGEFGATTFLTRAGTETMPIVIDRLLGRAGEVPRTQGFALAAVLMVCTALVIAVADRSEKADA